MWQNSRNQIVTNLNNSNCDKTEEKTQILMKRTMSDQFILLRITWHLDNQCDVFEAAICNLEMF